MAQENKKSIEVRNYSLDKMKDMTTMANTLRSHIEKHKLCTQIASNNYVHVDGWQFAGSLLNLFARVVCVENLSPAGETVSIFVNNKEIKKPVKKWSAEVEIIDLKTNNVVGRGFAICSNEEAKKKSFDEYAVMSMAQTRAVGKAYRTLIGWVIKLAGYESTPSEEMDEDIIPDNSQTPNPLPPLTDKDMAGIKNALKALNLIRNKMQYDKVVAKLTASKSKWNEAQLAHVEAVVIKVRGKLGLKD